jgi:hypothetical protein
MDLPPYSPDLALCGFWLFPKSKSVQKGQTFADIQCSVTMLLPGIAENGCKTVSSRVTMVPQSAWLHKKDILKATAPASVQVSKYCLDIPGIKLCTIYLSARLCVWARTLVEVFVAGH